MVRSPASSYRPGPGDAAVWFGLAVLLTGYVLAWRSEAPAALAYTQVVFLVAPSLFATFSSAAAWASRPGSLRRRVWTSLTIAAWVLFANEAALSYAAITDSFGDGMAQFSDAASAIAAVMLALAVGRSVGPVGVRRYRALRIGFDVLGLSTLVFLGTFSLVSGAEPLGAAAQVHAVRVSLYTAAGFFVLACAFTVTVLSQPRQDAWGRELTWGIAAFALAVLAWALLGVPDSIALRHESVLDIAPALLFMCGYYLMFVAAYRVVTNRSDSRPLRRGLRVAIDGSAAPGIAVATVLLAGIAVIGHRLGVGGLAQAPRGVYVSGLLVMVFCMVIRTALESLETSELEQTVRTDRVSGVPGPAALEEGIAQVLESCVPDGRPVAVMLVDIDDFAGVNARKGFRYGDRLLREVARVILRVAGPTRRVFRLTGDEFVVCGPVEDRRSAERLGVAILEGIRAAGSVDMLTASVGFTLCPVDGATTGDLLRRADRAKVWVKRHGKNSVVGFDERLGDAIDIEKRLSDDELSRRAIVRALCSAIDARDPVNRHHSRNVAALARLLAEHVGLDREHIKRVEIAAVLHDVGKIALPDQLLGGHTLSVRERRVEAEHSALGERLTGSLGIEGVPTWIRAHHERWDGNGYPDALAGSAIPLEARIIALADAYDGMTTGKRYGAPMSKAAALQEIDLGIGTRFDPELSEKFIAVVASTGALGWSDDWVGEAE